MRWFGSASTGITGDKPIKLTPATAHVLAGCVQGMLDGRRFDVVSEFPGGRRWSASGLCLTAVTVEATAYSPSHPYNGLWICARRHDEAGPGAPVHGLDYKQHPRLTFHSNGLTIESTAGRTEFTVTG